MLSSHIRLGLPVGLFLQVSERDPSQSYNQPLDFYTLSVPRFQDEEPRNRSVISSIAQRVQKLLGRYSGIIYVVTFLSAPARVILQSTDHRNNSCPQDKYLSKIMIRPFL